EYGQAESGFKKIIKEYPDFTVTPNSYYWLGEVYFLKNDWSRAAKQFFTAYQKYPTASKAADSLYRLGLTLHELHKFDESCSALARVSVEFPKSSNFIRQGAADAMSRFNCTEQ
ncbi:MAG: tol-pal system protein YbgF, partial [Alphaproteobacteria bacterium]|nr:tol-pal system protein YbgF [Alphaproteobacteria bacterium]